MSLMKINDLISDEELEECIEGCSDLSLIRQIIKLSQLENLLDEEGFADIFAFELRGFINEDSEEYDTAYEKNYDWGYQIASNINELLLSLIHI